MADVDEKFFTALQPLDCTVSKPPGDKTQETYLTFNETYGDYPLHASNAARRTRHQVQVHVFSSRDDGTHKTIFDQAIVLLKAAGIKVRSWGPDTYETETQRFHITATCELSH